MLSGIEEPRRQCSDDCRMGGKMAARLLGGKGRAEKSLERIEIAIDTIERLQQIEKIGSSESTTK
jgi:hypothetical protein